MKSAILSMACVSAVLVVPRVFANELPPAAALAQVESLLESCSRADPQSAPQFKSQRERLLQGISDADREKMRAAEEYKAAYKEISDRFDAASKVEAAKACKVFL